MCSTPVCGILCGQRQSLAGVIPAGLCGILGIPLFQSMNNTKTAPGPPMRWDAIIKENSQHGVRSSGKRESGKRRVWRVKNTPISYNTPKAMIALPLTYGSPALGAYTEMNERQSPVNGTLP